MNLVHFCTCLALLCIVTYACKQVDLKKVASIPGDDEVGVIFRNVGDASLSLFWVDFEGNEVKQGSFAGGRILSVTSYVNHVFRVRMDSLDTPIYEIALHKRLDRRYIDVGHNCSEPEINFTSSSTYSLINEQERSTLQENTSPCEVSPWLSRYVKVPGYHIACLTGIETETGDYILNTTFWADGYRAVEDYKYQDLLNPMWSDFRAYAESALGIRNTDAKVASAASKQIYSPPSWAVHRREIVSLNSVWRSDGPLLALIFEGGAFIYPGIDLGYERKVDLDGFPVTLVTLSIRPLVFTIESFLTETERDYVIANAAKHMKSSEVSLMDHDKGKKAKEFRTSQTYFMSSSGHSLLRSLDSRTANLTGMPTNHQEDLQVLRYQFGQYYLTHADYWDPVYYKGDDALMKSTHGGFYNRLATVFWYLSDCSGGFTAFPSAPVRDEHVSQPVFPTASPREWCPYDFRIEPKAGNAILFYSLLPSGEGDNLSVHTACKVEGSLKWAANKWVWNHKR